MIEYVDDDDQLYLRVLRIHLKAGGRVSSAAFKDRQGHPKNDISVDLARLTTPNETLTRDQRPIFGLGVLVARDVRALGFVVEHQPVDGNTAHVRIAGESSKAMCLLLAESTRLLLDAPGPSSQL